MADGSNIADILRAIGAYPVSDTPRAPRLGGEELTPAWQAFENGGLPRQMPRQMRSPELRAQDPDPHVSEPALAELQRRMAAAQATDDHGAYAPPEPVTWKEAGDKLLEFTGLPSVRRAAFHAGNSLINHENEWGDAAWEAGNAALMLAPAFEATRAMTAPAAAEARLGVMPPEAPPTPPPHYVGPNGMPIAPAQPFRNSLRYGSEDLADAAAMRSATGFDTSRTVYRGLGQPYDPENGGYYQAFTNSAADAREYGPNVMAANLRQGRNLAIDGGGNNFNSISASQLPADVRARLHPGAGIALTTDQIAHAAREAGYDSVTVRNVYDTRWGERPPAGTPQTVDFVFDTKNISPIEGYRYTPPPEAASLGRVRLSDSDRRLLAELERDMGSTPIAPEPSPAPSVGAASAGRDDLLGANDRGLLPRLRGMAEGDASFDNTYPRRFESPRNPAGVAYTEGEPNLGFHANDDTLPGTATPQSLEAVTEPPAPTGLKIEHQGANWRIVDYGNLTSDGRPRTVRVLPTGSRYQDARAAFDDLRRTRSAPDAGAAMGEQRLPTFDQHRGAVGDGHVSRQENRIYNDLNYHNDFTLEEVPRDSITLLHQTEEGRRTGEWYQAEIAAGRNPPPPAVARINGRLVMMDGHHRLASMPGDTVRVRVFDVDRVLHPPEGMRAVQNQANGAWRLEPNAPDGGAASVERTETPRRLGEDMGAPTTRPPWPEGIFTFAGENAVGANTQALSEARRMAAQGADRNEIWQRTGWFQGADGKWRFEIDDSGSRVSLPPEPPGMIELANQYARDNFGVRSIIDMRVNDPRRLEAIKYGQANTPTIEQLRSHRFQLGEVLHHAPLYEAYPEFQGLPVGREMGPGNHGSFAPTSRTMRLRNETPILGEKHDVRSTGLHETQHVIQDHEGFSPGSDPARFRGRYKEHLEQTEIAPLDRQIHDLMQQDSTAAELYRARNRGQAQLTGRGWTDADIDRQEQLESALRANPIGEQLADLDWRRSVSQRLISQVDDAADSAWAVEQYRRSSGETEARNVQTRRDFTPEERRSRPPWETQDIPDDQQIIGDVSASKPRLPKSSDVSASTYEEIARKSGIPTRTPKLGDDVDALAPLILSPALIAALQAYAGQNGTQQ